MSPAAGQGSLPFLYSDFHGGLNTLQAPYLLTDNEARDLSNVQGTTAGAIVKRNGLVTLASPSNTFTSLFPLESLGTLYLIGADSGAIYSVTSGGTVTSIKSSLSNARWEFCSAPVVSGQGPLFGMNGTDTPQQWTGSGSAANWTNASGAVAVPNGKYCLYANNQVFVAGVAANPSRVYWSAIADPTNWDPASLTGAGFMDFDPNDGQAITGLGRVGPYILVCKARKLWLLVDAATATARRLSDNVGCVAHRSIASGPEGTFFLSEDRGVYVTNGSKLTPISDKILPTVNGVSGTFKAQAAATLFNGHYHLSLPLSSSSNDTVLDYDTLLGSWWKHSFGSNQFAIWHPSGTAGLYSAKGTAAIVDQCFAANTFQDNGTNFTWTWRGPWQSPTFYRRRRFPTPYFRKRLRQVRFDGSGTVDFSIAKDFAGLETLVRANALAAASGGTFGASDGSVYGAVDGSMFGAASVQRTKILGGLGVANAFSIVFSATSNTADTVFSYTLLITDRRDLIVA